jgi:ABC-2 type transport system permease protein
MRELILGPIRTLNRIATQVGKELIQVRRRPGAMISLIFGPFVIMALFGLGYTGVHRPLDVAIVIPAGSPLSRDPAYYQGVAGPGVAIAGIVDDRSAAEAELANQTLDMLVVVPANLQQSFRDGEQVKLDVMINEIDPVAVQYADFMTRYLAQRINEEVIKQAVAEGQTFARAAGTEFVDIDPQVIAAPTTAEVSNIAPESPGIVDFAAPAVLALILQHMAVTITALSLVRERTSGTFEFFRVSPVNAVELIFAKYVGLGVLSGVVAAITLALLVGLLGVPMLGSPWLIAGVIGLLIFASLSIGLLISVVSDSERQAVQLALLLLLASVFFSGMVLAVDEFTPIVQAISYALPVTHGIQLLQELMLRGQMIYWWQIAALALIGGVVFLATVVLLRRQLRSA